MSTPNLQTSAPETAQPDSMLRDLSTPLVRRPVLEEISVVIPTLGRPILESCLRFVADGSYWPARLIIVDQGRNPVVQTWLAQLQAAGLPTLYVPSSQRGRAAGINRGLEQVHSLYVAITDDDCFVEAGWLRNMTARLQEEPGVIFTGRVELAGSEVEFSTVTSRISQRYTRPQLKVHPFIGGNAGMAMAVVQKIGLFDEHPALASAEDSDYGYRALKLGIPIAYDPDVVLYHYHWRDASQRAARYADYARSQGGFYGTHLRRGDGLILLQALRDLARSPLRWARGVAKGDTELAENGRANTLNLLPGIAAGLARKDA
jgi:GT2 family glycosyltransferase